MSIFDDRFKKDKKDKAMDEFSGTTPTQIDRTTELYHKLSNDLDTLNSSLSSSVSDVQSDVNDVSASLQTHINDKNNPHDTKISNLLDVNLTSLSDGEGLVYKVSVGKWINATIGGSSGGGSTYGSREVYYSNVNPTVSVNPSYDGAMWINYSTGRLFICKDKTTDNNIWVATDGEYIIAPINISNLVAEYKFQNISGATLSDTSGNGNDATVYGSPTTETGLVDTRLILDGVDDYIAVPSSIFYTNEEKGAVALMVTKTQESGSGVIFYTTESRDRGLLLKEIRGSIEGYMYNGGLSKAEFVEGGEIKLNEHNFIVFQWDRSRSNYELWVNGKLVGEIYDSSDTSAASDTTDHWFFKKGSNVPSEWSGALSYFVGKAETIRIYSKFLTEEEIKKLYSYYYEGS